jgi:hypothetical protein
MHVDFTAMISRFIYLFRLYKVTSYFTHVIHHINQDLAYLHTYCLIQVYLTALFQLHLTCSVLCKGMTTSTSLAAVSINT